LEGTIIQQQPLCVCVWVDIALACCIIPKTRL